MNTLKFEKVRSVLTPIRWHETDSGLDFFIPEDITCVDTFVSEHEPKDLVLKFHETCQQKFFDENWVLVVEPWENIKIPLGIVIELPEGCDMTFFNRSSIASKRGLVVWACVIDNWYRGELIVNLINVTNKPTKIQRGEKIVQGIIRKVEYLTTVEGTVLTETERGEGWFWSTNFTLPKK